MSSSVGEVPDPRPEVSMAMNMEVVLASMLSEIILTASGARPMSAMEESEGVQLLGKAVRYGMMSSCCSGIDVHLVRMQYNAPLAPNCCKRSNTLLIDDPRPLFESSIICCTALPWMSSRSGAVSG
jgi:hypothetical protein